MPAHGKLRQEDGEFEASLGYIPCLKKIKKGKKRKRNMKGWAVAWGVAEFTPCQAASPSLRDSETTVLCTLRGRLLDRQRAVLTSDMKAALFPLQH
jgi:hypothetical protein